MITKTHHLQNLLLVLLLLLFFQQVRSRHCELIRDGTELICSEISRFPGGTYPAVETINFHNSNLTELNASVFDNRGFYSLKTAYIRHCNIDYIEPNAFANMKNMLELVLHGNNLTNFHDNTFIGLTLLEHLDLGHNQITVMDSQVLKPMQSLNFLDLSYNYIRGLAPNLITGTNILQLQLSGNPIQFIKRGPIFESASLTELTLQYCRLKELPEKAFSKLPNLIFLDLSKNELKVLPNGIFQGLASFEHLDISYNFIVNLNYEMFHVPSKLEALYCEENSFKPGLNCGEFRRKLTEISKEVAVLKNKGDDKEEEISVFIKQKEEKMGNKERDRPQNDVVTEQYEVTTTLTIPLTTVFIIILSLLNVLLSCLLLVKLINRRRRRNAKVEKLENYC